ncbi:cyanophycinase [Mucilaginibacter gracilis]|uniref:Cyanophycinase n=1 Tax=Mucilaginibacter gracilis TaxID=423350 RepID=A0A495IUN8_9SPHI|nr:cyanophycinase [Mucilaginibacter gracilis]RKR80420.1 cyanophycinase [Mucilaginibacter gracilis]
MKKNIFTGLLLLSASFAALAQEVPAKKVLTPINVYPAIRITKSPTRHGPENGSLLIIGGNEGDNKAIWNKFTELAGGKDKAIIVVVTTAAGDGAVKDVAAIDSIKKHTGITNVTLLHTTDLKTANSKQFIEPLTKATGVFFVGGRQWRIADAYLNTLTHKAFFDVLARGGVIAGTSAGASIQGSFLWRGDTHGPEITIGDHTQGLGFLKNSAIDQHLFIRNREFDLVELIRKSPKLIGIGIDEATAVVIQKDTLSVVGNSFVAIYDHATIAGLSPKHVINNNEDYNNSDGPYFLLHDGQRYDLNERKVIIPPRRPRGLRAPRPAVPGTTPAPPATKEP